MATVPVSFSRVLPGSAAEVAQPGTRSRPVARLIGSDRLVKARRVRHFRVGAYAGQPHRVPRGYAALRGFGKSGKLRFWHLAGFPLVGEGGHKGECARQTNDIGRAFCHCVLCLRAGLEPARQHQRFGCDSSGPLCETDEIRPASRSVGGGFRTGEISPAADVDQIDGSVLKRRHHLQRLIFTQPALQLIRRIELHADRKLWPDGGARGLYGFQQQPHAVGDRPAVRIASPVEQRRQELAEQKSVRRMDLHSAETGLLRQPRCPRDQQGKLLDLLRCHFRTAQPRQVKRARAPGSAGRRIGERSGMAELQPELHAVGSALAGELTKTLQIGRFVKHKIAGLFSVTRCALNLADDGKRRPAFGPVPIQPDLFRRRMARSVSKGIRHRRFRDPVFQDDTAGQCQG